MEFQLNAPLARNGNADSDDVRRVKKALNRLGYYQPYEKVGITDIADAVLFEALKTFQKDQGLTPSGTIKPGDDTEQALARESTKTPSGYYIWRTVEDDKVRGAHAALNRTVRRWDDSPDPGEDFNCRCWSEPVEIKDAINPDYPDAINPVYPEAILIPLFRLNRLHSIWRLWLNRKNNDWTLGNHKSKTRWGNQIRSRDWTPEQISNTLKYGKKYQAPNKVNPKNTATRYEYKGRYVVQDDQTKEILQISDKNFIPNKFP